MQPDSDEPTVPLWKIQAFYDNLTMWLTTEGGSTSVHASQQHQDTVELEEQIETIKTRTAAASDNPLVQQLFADLADSYTQLQDYQRVQNRIAGATDLIERLQAFIKDQLALITNPRSKI